MSQTAASSAARPATVTAPPMHNYSAFDAQLTHKALNMRLFLRLLKWAKPYRATLIVSAVLIIVGSGVSTLTPVLQNRIIVDEILKPGAAASVAAANRAAASQAAGGAGTEQAAADQAQAADLAERPDSPASAAPVSTDGGGQRAGVAAAAEEMPHYGLLTLLHWLMDALALPALMVAVGLYVLMFVMQTLIGVAQQLLLTSGALKTLRDLRNDLFASLERKPASFYDHVAVGRVMTRVTNDVENLFELLVGFVGRAGILCPFFLSLAIMLDYSFHLTSIGLVMIPITAASTFLFRYLMRRIFRLIRDSVSALNQYMQEDLIGIEVVQISGREEANCAEYRRLNGANRDYEYRAINYEVVFETFNMNLASVATACLLWLGGGQVVQESISLGVLLLFNQYLTMMVMPIESVGRFFNTLFRAMASGERIFQALDWDERLHEPTRPVRLPERLRGEVEFRDTRFAYAGGEQVLHGVSFRIAPGEKLAIVGPTGSGKSTIIRLLARFYDFADGMIFLDGVDVNQIASGDLRRRVGVVLQDFHIFSGTVEENISLNNPDIGTERVRWAAKAVGADRFIAELPDGYQTELAERGHNLSQGQQQLLAFARVLASDPEILVLDEATSSIDTGTELVIQEALHKLTEGRTSIIIAHRLQTIQECDRVLVLHHGAVKEFGTHDELLAMRGIYYTLNELQFQDSKVAAELAGEADELQRERRWVDTSESDDDEVPFPQTEVGNAPPGMRG